MSGRAHRQELRGESTTQQAGGVDTQKDTAPDGKNEDFQGMYRRAAADSKSRGDAGEPSPLASPPFGESGSEILDYQEPIQQQKKGRRGVSRDSAT